MILDLPLALAGVIAGAVLLYVILDGFDLGVGILFPFARRPADRDVMMTAIAPVWDGNETWLVLGGGGLMAAFPLAYAALMPALYQPVVLMLLALILRGTAFEFRIRGRRTGKAFWTAAFAGGSLAATFAQGLVLGGFIQGVRVEAGAFAGGPLDWLTPYTVLVACGLVAGYALLGACWLVLKAEGELRDDARRWAARAAWAAAALMAAVSLATLFLHPRIAERWGIADGAVDWARLGSLAVIPAVGLLGLAVVLAGLRRDAHRAPLIGGWLLFLSGYAGLAVGLAPYAVPYALTFRQAAAADNALALLGAGLAALLPLILAYTVWVYWIFRGKVAADGGYH